MDDYVEDYKYNNCFWMKSGLLYSHAEDKFKEFYSTGTMLNQFSILCKNFYEGLNKIPNLYKPVEKDENSTRYAGIQAIIRYINQIAQNIKSLYSDIEKIASTIFERQYAYESKKNYIDLCEKDHKQYQDELTKLKLKKESYFDAINKAIETHLTNKFKGKQKKINPKIVADVNKKKTEYKEQISSVDKFRVEYMNVQGNIFAYEEEFEKECTNDIKQYFLSFLKSFDTFKNSINISDSDLEIINEINGEKDNNIFAEKNKSLMTGPKRNLYKEYSQDLNYYIEHFDCVKKEMKNKSPNEIREIRKTILQEVAQFLNEIIKEEPNEIHNKILEIAKKLKENKCTEGDYQYLENKFQERFNQFLKWKKDEVKGQDYKKVGPEWDERFCYMHTFLGYINKTRVENKELDELNFNFLCNAMKKILELNENEDIDYSLCDLIVILSSTFYMIAPNNKNGKKFVNEVIKNTSIMQKQGFWVGLTKFELNEEIQHQKKEEETLKEDTISEEKITNSIIAKLMSVCFNILQFVTDSNTFNRIIFDIFKYCKINEKSRESVVEMIQAQIEVENLTYIQLDKKIIFGKDK